MNTLNVKPTFVMLVGVPGSGKSTYATERGKDMINTKYFSSDAIRGEIYGDENCQNDPGRVFAIMQERTVEALKSGCDVIYDATNITRKNRKTILDMLPPYVTKECVVVWAPIGVCIERDSKRDRTVGKEVIMKMLKRFEAPFYDEGFDIISVQTSGYYPDVIEYFETYMNDLNIPHDNPHHTAGVAEHCYLCYKNLETEDVPELVKFAGRVHDIGKPLTKTFVNTKGETTDVAHYYGHQSVGAWISYGFSMNEPTLPWLVSTHMAPFVNQKYFNSLPPVYKSWIEALHKADKEAH